jgi:hypothetical protein
MADIVGPPLDQLNAYGNLDQMRQEALDASFWTALAIREGEATPSVSATLSSSSIRIRFGVAAPSASATVTPEGIRIQLGEGNTNVTATITADGIRVQFGASLVVGPATMTAAGGIVVSATATPATQALINAVVTGEFIGAASLSSVVTFTETDVEILGENWSIVGEGDETWTEISEGTEIWTVVSEGSESWNVQ